MTAEELSIRLAISETKVAIIETKLTYLEKRIDEECSYLEKRISDMDTDINDKNKSLQSQVNKKIEGKDIHWIRMIVFGMVALILTAVGTAIINTVVHYQAPALPPSSAVTQDMSHQQPMPTITPPPRIRSRSH